MSHSLNLINQTYPYSDRPTCHISAQKSLKISITHTDTSRKQPAAPPATIPVLLPNLMATACSQVWPFGAHAVLAVLFGPKELHTSERWMDGERDMGAGEAHGCMHACMVRHGSARPRNSRRFSRYKPRHHRG